MKLIKFDHIPTVSTNAVRITDDLQYVNAIDLVQFIEGIPRAAACEKIRNVPTLPVGFRLIPAQMGRGRKTTLIPLRYATTLVNLVCIRTPMEIVNAFNDVLKSVLDGDHSRILDSRTFHPGDDDEDQDADLASSGAGACGAPASLPTRLPLVVKPAPPPPSYSRSGAGLSDTAAESLYGSPSSYPPPRTLVRIGLGENGSIRVYSGNVVKVDDLIRKALSISPEAASEV